MHRHDDLTVRSYLVTLMSDDLPHPQVHQIAVETLCCCDMWDFVRTLDLPLDPAFMIIQRRAPLKMAGTPGFRSSRSS
jgi:hypothetical protein